ncbi:YraN family protein [Alteromonas lipolytica]|uniref:UPF0102 protein BFC17_06060 n=1 Tax=Alteromonas lipolytica TaxID=1856405 RepID=A0A1E8F9Y8_9ALTE|nr:YraN family protein [Alteromonas lipolytica]OFI32715.1 hypothetical protein BFC17_06060 [Alteromonas lipolytica]GGF73798.1 UPF0102 protein [Alteromonas lipolytica]
MARWIGANQEQRAERYLRQLGLTPVARNITYRGSEIDLIMKEQHTWVCIEVKYRQRNSHGQAAESINPAKIHRMGTAFQRYLSDNGVNPNMVPMRLDAVVIDGDDIKWLKNIGQ